MDLAIRSADKNAIHKKTIRDSGPAARVITLPPICYELHQLSLYFPNHMTWRGCARFKLSLPEIGWPGVDIAIAAIFILDLEISFQRGGDSNIPFDKQAQRLLHT